MLDRNSILNANDARTERIPVPEWDGEVCIRAMSGRQRDQFEQRARGQDLTNIRAFVVCLCACDESGKRLFTDSDVEALGDKNAAALDKIFWAALKLNRIGSGDIDELKKN